MQKNVRNIPCIFYYSAFSNGIVHKEFAICIGDTFAEKNSFGVLFPTFSLSGSRTSKSAIVAHSSSSYFPRLFIIFPLLPHFSTLLNKQRKPKEECVLASNIYQNCVSMHLGKHKYMYACTYEDMHPVSFSLFFYLCFYLTRLSKQNCTCSSRRTRKNGQFVKSRGIAQ